MLRSSELIFLSNFIVRHELYELHGTSLFHEFSKTFENVSRRKREGSSIKSLIFHLWEKKRGKFDSLIS